MYKSLDSTAKENGDQNMTAWHGLTDKQLAEWKRTWTREYMINAAQFAMHFILIMGGFIVVVGWPIFLIAAALTNNISGWWSLLYIPWLALAFIWGKFLSVMTKAYDWTDNIWSD